MEDIQAFHGSDFRTLDALTKENRCLDNGADTYGVKDQKIQTRVMENFSDSLLHHVDLCSTYKGKS